MQPSSHLTAGSARSLPWASVLGNPQRLRHPLQPHPDLPYSDDPVALSNCHFDAVSKNLMTSAENTGFKPYPAVEDREWDTAVGDYRTTGKAANAANQTILYSRKTTGAVTLDIPQRLTLEDCVRFWSHPGPSCSPLGASSSDMDPESESEYGLLLATPPGLLRENPALSCKWHALSLDDSNVWCSSDCKLPPLAERLGAVKQGNRGENGFSDCIAKHIGGTGEPVWLRAFWRGTGAIDEIRRKWFAERVVYLQGNPASWAEEDLKQLCNAVLIRTIELYDSNEDNLPHFVGDILAAFSCDQSSHKRLVRILSADCQRVFTTSWKQNYIESYLETRTLRVMGGLNLSRLIGDLVRLRIIPLQALVNSMESLYGAPHPSKQHLQAMLYLITTAGPGPWKDATLTRRHEICLSVLSFVAKAVEQGSTLPDYISDSRPNPGECFSRVVEFFAQVSKEPSRA
ncbi:hypothetical protein D9611_011066 [Ephemerocybe angulata]|uniref:Uncharacterized protein n=1 Tax=Ephemerocybe angulata TaxID=980116 RepID=A0A8H5BCN1_9AGAR|nr:hypothetical protein D9611_011066 [Tulosesus angulatus]